MLLPGIADESMLHRQHYTSHRQPAQHDDFTPSILQALHSMPRWWGLASCSTWTHQMLLPCLPAYSGKQSPNAASQV